MIYANNNNKRIKATETGQRAECPGCGEVVISRCGEYKENHWAHKKDSSSCKYKPMSDFHLMVQSLFDDDCLEKISTDYNGEKHIADIVVNGLVLEVQNSPIKLDEIRKRNLHHKNIVWVLNWDTIFGNSFFMNYKNMDTNEPRVYREDSRKKLPLNWKDMTVFIYRNDKFYLSKINGGNEFARIFSIIKKQDFADLINRFSYQTKNIFDFAVQEKEYKHELFLLNKELKKNQDKEIESFSIQDKKEQLEKCIQENEQLQKRIDYLRKRVESLEHQKIEMYQIVQNEVSNDYDEVISELQNQIKVLKN